MSGLNELAPLSCEDVEAEHAAYVWGALQSHERARVERHRAQCATCDERLRASQRVISQLDEAAPRVNPPGELRARVLGAVAELDSTRRAQAPQPLTGPVPPVRLRPPATHRRTFFAGLATGVTGALAAAALLVLVIVRPEGLGVIPAGGPAFTQEPSANEVRPWPWQLLQGAQTSSAQRLVLIKLQAAAGQGGGLLTYDGDTGRGVLMLEDVAPGAEYTVWLVRGSQRVQLGSLQTDADGFGTFVLPRPLPVEQPERIEVTGADSASSSVLTGTF